MSGYVDIAREAIGAKPKIGSAKKAKEANKGPVSSHDSLTSRPDFQAPTVVASPIALFRLCEEACRGLDLRSRELMGHLTFDDGQALQAGQESPQILRAYAEALADHKVRERGEVPAHYTAETNCAGCGPVPIFEGAPEDVAGCPWCWNRLRGLPVPKAADAGMARAGPGGRRQVRGPRMGGGST